MILSNLINYEEYIFSSLITSKYAQNLLSTLLIYITTGIVKFHLSILIYWLFNGDFFTEMILPIFTNVLLSQASPTMFSYIKTHDQYYTNFSKYLISNYSRANFKKWKRIVLLILFIYSLIGIYMVTVDNLFLLITLLQTFCSVVICEVIDNYQYIFYKIHNMIYKPKVTIMDLDFYLVNNYGNSKLVPRAIKASTKNILNNVNNFNNFNKLPNNFNNLPIIQDTYEFTEIINTTNSTNSTSSPNSTSSTELIRSTSPPIIEKPVTPPLIRHRNL